MPALGFAITGMDTRCRMACDHRFQLIRPGGAVAAYREGAQGFQFLHGVKYISAEEQAAVRFHGQGTEDGQVADGLSSVQDNQCFIGGQHGFGHQKDPRRHLQTGNCFL